MPTDVESRTRTDRRARFREYMQKLNPTAPAQSVIDSGLALKDLHGSLYKVMAARADLDPGSQQILVGGIGSGKTTELLLTQEWLSQKQGSIAMYIDVSSETDLSDINSGALLASFGLNLSQVLNNLQLENGLTEQQKSRLRASQAELRRFALGKTERRWIPDSDFAEHYAQELDESDYEPGQYVTVRTPGKLQPPLPALQREIRNIQSAIESLVSFFRGREADIVVIFDGLDRLLTPEKFWAMAHQDLRVIRALQIAVIAAAPLAILYGSGKSVAEQFDRVHHMPAVQIDPGKSQKLNSVLLQRGASMLMSRIDIAKTSEASGGVLRDLITLARDAGEIAYIDGSEGVNGKHIELAAAQLGEGYLRGLNPGHKKVLQKLAKDKLIDVASKISVELLATRRILEYSATDFRVHPALLPLLKTNQENE